MSIADKIAPPGWMGEPDTAKLFDALKRAGHTLRFVGGCVRDIIAERPVTDIDVATDARPEQVLEALAAAMIRTIPTGIEHGTVTALPGKRRFEITTLRKDVETDGRRATVAFTDNWTEDASRRDFTFNALSADPDGKVYDYFGGIEDLRAGRVRFIGGASERIAEDYLRVMRFFRFQAYYGKMDPDPASLAACQAAAKHVETLSGERIWNEMSRTLAAPEPAPVFQMMEDIGLLPLLLPAGRTLKRMDTLASIEAMLSLEADPIRRLAALTQPDNGQLLDIATQLRLSRQDTRRLKNVHSSRGEFRTGMDDIALRRALYALRRERFLDLILLDWANQIAIDAVDAAESVSAWRTIWNTASAWKPPKFPIAGEDVLAMGVEAGPRVGEILANIEEWWVENSFLPDREACLEKLRLFVSGC